MTKMLPLLAGSMLLAAAAAVPATASAATGPGPMMAHTELQRGMKGVCRTVFQGSKIEPFEFDILEIMHGQLGPKRDLILARLDSDNARFTGVVAGMSGSPCYVDNKLIGALSYRFGQFTKEPIAGITPIADMIKLFDLPNTPAPLSQQSYKPLKFKEYTANLIKQAQLPTPASGGGGAMEPIATPLTFSGFDQRVLDSYRGDLLKLGFDPVAGSSSGSTGNPKAPKSLEMGSSVAGQLVRGDISISGTGTVSYLDGNKVLAFGHPFFNSGRVRIPMATSYVNHILVSEAGSYKMAEDGQEVGTINQDRLTAIAGTLGEHTPMIPIELGIHDQSTMDPTSLKFEVFQDPAMTPMMMAMAVQNSLSSRLQFNNGGNLSVHGVLRLDGRDVPIDKFYSAPEQAETPSAAAQDLGAMLSALWNNPFRAPKIDSLKLDFSFKPLTRISAIDEAWADQTEARPGDTLTLNVRLRSYRGQTNIQQIKFTVPADTPYGPMLLFVSSGPALDNLVDGLKSGYSSYDELVADLAKHRSNTRLYVKAVTDEPGLMVYSQLYSKLPGTVVEQLDQPSNANNALPLMRSLGAEVSQPLDVDLQGQKVLNLMISPRGRVLN